MDWILTVGRRLVPSGRSISRVKGEYCEIGVSNFIKILLQGLFTSICTAATFAILAARRSVVDETQERPMCLIFPSLAIIVSKHLIRAVTILTLATPSKPASSAQSAFLGWRCGGNLLGYQQTAPISLPKTSTTTFPKMSSQKGQTSKHTFRSCSLSSTS